MAISSSEVAPKPFSANSSLAETISAWRVRPGGHLAAVGEGSSDVLRDVRTGSDGTYSVEPGCTAESDFLTALTSLTYRWYVTGGKYAILGLEDQ